MLVLIPVEAFAWIAIQPKYNLEGKSILVLVCLQLAEVPVIEGCVAP